MTDLHPVWAFVGGAVLIPFVRGTARRIVSIVAPTVGMALVLACPEGARISVSFLGGEWVLMYLDPLARVFALAFSCFTALAGLYGWGEPRALVRSAGLGLGGAGVGVVLSGDLISLFFFWEWMSVCSLVLIWSSGRSGARAAGLRYLYLHLAGGACLLAGLVALSAGGPVPAAAPVALEGWGPWLVLAGFSVNAAIPPLHAWLPDAYPEASPLGTVFLSAFTTKAAVYALARVFPGAEALVWTGAAMALYGVVFAVLENDIRRLLAYHIVSQVGYMVCGVGLGSSLAVNGTAAHALSNIFCKGLLLMSAGAVLHATGRSKLTELGGLARMMPGVLVFYAVGAFSISGVPGFSGFVSKGLVVSAAGAQAPLAELMLVVASMGTFLHTGLKLPIFTFFEAPRGAELKRHVPPSMSIAMGLTAAICILAGFLPEVLYAGLPHPLVYRPYTADHVLGAFQLLLATTLGFWLLRSKLGGEPTVTLDVDRLYRAVIPRLIGAATWVLLAPARLWTARALPDAETARRLLPPIGRRSFAHQVAALLAVFLALAAIGLALLGFDRP